MIESVMTRPKPMTLIILDGWGYREEIEANAIAAAKKPNWDALWQQYPHTLISGSGTCVGLPDGQMGNSEVGHMTMGAGRTIYQDLTRIDLAIQNGDFFQNSVLVEGLLQAQKNQKAVHLMGLLSKGGVHSHEHHLHALIQLASQLKLPHVYIHVFLDGRDTPPKSAASSLQTLEAICQKFQCGKIVSLIGRYYAMDRDKRWDRIQKAYKLLQGEAEYHAPSALEGLMMAYDRGETDEFVLPTSIHLPNESAHRIQDDDVLIFTNFRSDRAREITEAFIDEDFSAFPRGMVPSLGQFISLTEYDAHYRIPVAFPTQTLPSLLGQYVSELGLKQLRMAETEKYAHVTFFFNGGIEKPYPLEDRVLIPSPSVATYDLQPEMSAFSLTDRLIQEIQTKRYDLIICNFANPDMVGHSGNFEATVKAIEVIDQCLGQIVPALQAEGGEVIITADHGNAEKMYDPINNQVHTAHTNDPIPFIYIGRPAQITPIKGSLTDIAPTLLYLMGLPIPQPMTGKNLVKLV